MLFPDYFAPIVLTVSFISIKAWFYGTKDKALNLCLIPPLKKKKDKETSTVSIFNDTLALVN